MQIQTFLSLASLLLLPALSDLQLDSDDVPQNCFSVCSPVVELTHICDSDDDAVGGSETEGLLERQCICTNNSFDVANRTAQCAACLSQSGQNDDNLDDINDIMSACGFQSTTFNNVTSAASESVVATKPTASSDLTTTFSATTTGGGVGGAGTLSSTNRPTDASDKPNDESGALRRVEISMGGVGALCFAAAFVAGVMMAN
ncbi:hypothetical protein jhhlp_005746 [Lomentospora prolificans]|uniref:Protein CAP22 n=1 Tax=Lomentospora prolificans TaxID=41688 RepID=A0A2N3N3Y8_9PEZI|nr:hypothetical protein jhhlp_005746 [Lomentospora prolificans]